MLALWLFFLLHAVAMRYAMVENLKPVWRNFIDRKPFVKWPPDNALPFGKEILRIGYLASAKSSQKTTSQVGELISGAMTLAVEEINNRTDLLPNHFLQFLYADTYGYDELGVQYTSRLFEVDQVSAIIGPQETCLTEARMAHSYNKLMVSYHCAQHEVSNKNEFSTFLRTRSSDSSAAHSVITLLSYYHWNKVALLHSKSPLDPGVIHYDNIYKAIIKAFTEFNITLTGDMSFESSFYGFPNSTDASENYHELFDKNNVMTDFERIIDQTYKWTRIYMIIGSASDIIPFMFIMGQRKLLASGSYFVIGVDPIDPFNPLDPAQYTRGNLYHAYPSLLYECYQSLFLIMRSAPINEDFDVFTDSVVKYNQMQPFSLYFDTPLMKPAAEKLYPSALLYDAVYAYARAVHSLLESSAGGDINNGQELMRYLVSTTYMSKTGYLVKIDSNGDAEGSYSIYYRREEKTHDPQTGKFGVYPAADFLVTKGKKLPTLTWRNYSSVSFVSGSPPLDEPVCGFHQEYCPQQQPEPVWQITLGTLFGLTLLSAVAGVIYYRRRQYEQDLKSLIWKVEYKDIHQDGRSLIGVRMNRLASLIRESSSGGDTAFSSLNSLYSSSDHNQPFIQVGSYKGLVVAVKRIRKKTVVITRSIQKELKLMRDVRHDNLVSFIGACVEPGNVLILLEYCAKGSLQDILQNSEVKLDEIFVNSLISDVLRGMIFLHDSEIHYHGNLKSSNCVIDSKWVLKLTDYGLHEFKAGESEEFLSESQHYWKMLWTAPEFLRGSKEIIFPQNYQQGDVYSFAIVAYEICSRNGPFGDYHMEYNSKEIFARVRNGCDFGTFRPKLGALGSFPQCVTECIRDCWAEEPDDRPDFRAIRYRLKPIQRGMKANILDNVIAIMEKYATNLESIVQERTEQLIEEKLKTEELLHQMLPRSVADQLKHGKEVEAESFESVTIYFSDICEFTSLSSASTPIEIVTLLNDLYTVFDGIVELYDVYKVETIGDAYMVVSGLPKRNGINHAGEIASLSLHLLSSMKQFTIRHRPKETLKLRIGFHSGPCVAGVVGLKMPRYCLFGDTVNTASRVESTGQALKIHCSRSAKLLLDKLGGYTMQERGLVAMKGKGEQLTYWLLGEEAQVRVKRLELRGQAHLSGVDCGRRHSTAATLRPIIHPSSNSWKPLLATSGNQNGTTQASMADNLSGTSQAGYATSTAPMTVSATRLARTAYSYRRHPKTASRRGNETGNSSGMSVAAAALPLAESTKVTSAGCSGKPSSSCDGQLEAIPSWYTTGLRLLYSSVGQATIDVDESEIENHGSTTAEEAPLIPMDSYYSTASHIDIYEDSSEAYV